VSIWYLMWVFNIAVWLWVALMRLRMCGCEDWGTLRTCTRVHTRPCYVEYYETHHYGKGVMRIGKASEEHVWTNDEYLALFDPC
jgi:hypothetical protein